MTQRATLYLLAMVSLVVCSGATQADEPKASTTDTVIALAHRLIGGEWIHESKTKNGKPFYARSIVEDGPDGVSVIMKNWRGGADGMYYHGNIQLWRESDGKRMRFHNINQSGNRSAGEVRAVGDNTLEWDWFVQPETSTTKKFHLQFVFEGDNVFRMVLLEPKGDTWSVRADERFERVDSAPEKFKKLLPKGSKK